MSGLTIDKKTMKNTTIDVTFGGVFDYVGLKDFKICHFLSLTMIWGL